MEVEHFDSKSASSKNPKRRVALWANSIIKYTKTFGDTRAEFLEKVWKPFLHELQSVNSKTRGLVYKLMTGDPVNNDLMVTYFETVQEEVQEIFTIVNNGEIQVNFSTLARKLANLSWGELNPNKRSEEQFIEDISTLMITMELETVLHINDSNNWNFWISLVFNIIKQNQLEKINMFDTLFKFSATAILVARDAISTVISAEGKLASLEICRQLAVTSDMLQGRYEVLLEREANRRLSATNSLELILGNPILEKIDSLHSNNNPFHFENSLHDLTSFLNNTLEQSHQWTEHFAFAIDKLFKYGKFIIGEDCQHLEENSCKAFLEILQDLSELDGSLEKRIFSSQAFKKLQNISNETGVNQNSQHILGERESLLYEKFENCLHSLFIYKREPEDGGLHGFCIENQFCQELLKPHETLGMIGMNDPQLPDPTTSMDDIYSKLDHLMHSLSIHIHATVPDQDILDHSVLRLVFLLSFITIRSGRIPFGNGHLLAYLFEYFEDLIWSTSPLITRLAKLSLKTWYQNFGHLLPPFLR
ncbi:hypothetical protein CROQUDRAFT_87043 [Cronartium quercuum f. sp. fusiforme G11]|uniref:Uncharacterized protein n=1 Tax=Cronartium quercuum f. sp. fusiforme G11 TaxID=708437 RepID=A0A9P6TGZ0_9BASI|nr:hypothetical protein CROQUDRAFT_87043 [Cronartium quercuum f. sp. fusiforme G11]